MTISSTNRLAGPYTGVGTVFTYPFGFKVFQASDILVQQTDTSGNITTLVLTTNYTVALNPNQNANPGGSITLLVALPTGYQLVISSQVLELQGTSITNNGGFYPQVIENSLDYLTILVQQLQTSVNNCLKLPITIFGVSPQLPIPTAGQLLAWNSTATALVNTSPSGVGVGNVTGGAAGAGGNIASNTITDVNVNASAGIQSTKLAYLRNATGAVTRTVLDKLSDIISVKDFGATGNGTTDDTAAITAALTYAGTLNSATVFFPVGTYKVSSALTIPINTTLSGYGINATTIQLVTASTTLLSAVFSTATIANIEICDMTLLSTVASTVGVRFVLCFRTRMFNVRFSGIGRNFEIDRGEYHEVIHCHATSNSTIPCGWCRVWSSSDTDYCWAVTVENFKYENTGTGCNATADPALFYARRCVTLYVSKLYSFDCSTGGTPCSFIVLENDSQGCKFTDCEASLMNYGFTAQTGSGVNVPPTFFQVDSLDIDQPIDNAVVLTNCQFATFNGGSLTPSAAHNNVNVLVIQTGATHVTFNGMKIYNFSASPASGVYFNGGTYIAFNNCQIDSCYNGFNFAAGSGNIRVLDCIVSNCTNSAVNNIAEAGNLLANNMGINPLTVTTPSFPATGVAVTNTTGVRCTVYITGGTITAIGIQGKPLTLTSGAFDLDVGGAISINYTGSPSWTWVGH